MVRSAGLLVGSCSCAQSPSTTPHNTSSPSSSSCGSANAAEASARTELLLRAVKLRSNRARTLARIQTVSCEQHCAHHWRMEWPPHLSPDLCPGRHQHARTQPKASHSRRSRIRCSRRRQSSSPSSHRRHPLPTAAAAAAAAALASPTLTPPPPPPLAPPPRRPETPTGCHHHQHTAFSPYNFYPPPLTPASSLTAKHKYNQSGGFGGVMRSTLAFNRSGRGDRNVAGWKGDGPMASTASRGEEGVCLTRASHRAPQLSCSSST